MANRLITSIALLAFGLSACSTVGVANNPIETRWIGRSAGEFFAKYSPPISDTDAGSTTIYSWRGGYQRVKTTHGRVASMSCSAKITVARDYTILGITIVSDRPGKTGPSYCAELLAAP